MDGDSGDLGGVEKGLTDRIEEEHTRDTGTLDSGVSCVRPRITIVRVRYVPLADASTVSGVRLHLMLVLQCPTRSTQGHSMKDSNADAPS